MTMTSFPRRTYMFALAILFAIAAIVSTANPSAAQESSTSSTLAAPVLTARASANSIELSWEAVDGAARYDLWTRPRGGDWQQLDDGDLTDTTYSHTDVTAATTYTYQMRAVSETGEASELSQRVSATFAGSLVAPVLMVQAAGDAVELNWELVAGADGYELFVWSGAGDWQPLGEGTLTGTSSHYRHTELVTDKTYYYLIRAVTVSEVGPWSQQVTATVTDAQSSTSTPTPTQTPTPTLDSTPTSTPTPTPTLDSTPTSTPTPTPTLDRRLRLLKRQLRHWTRHLRLPQRQLRHWTRHLRLPQRQLRHWTRHLRLPQRQLRHWTRHLRLPQRQLRHWTRQLHLTQRQLRH